MGLFSSITDNWLGFDDSGGIGGALKDGGLGGAAAGFILGGPIGLAAGAFGGDAIEDFGKDISGQTAEDALKASSLTEAEALQQFLPYYMQSVQSGVSQIDPLTQSSTAAGYGQNIGDIMNSGALDSLISDRQDAATNYMASRGLRRSGAAAQEAANIPTDLAMQIESELNNRKQNLYSGGMNSLTGGANLQTTIGNILSGGTTDALAAKSAGTSNIMNLITTGLGAAFSDARLKDNIEEVGQIGPLPVISWTWNADAEKLGLAGQSSGFRAQDVQKTHPHHVMTKGEHLTIDYDSLLKELKLNG